MFIEVSGQTRVEAVVEVHLGFDFIQRKGGEVLVLVVFEQALLVLNQVLIVVVPDLDADAADLGVNLAAIGAVLLGADDFELPVDSDDLVGGLVGTHVLVELGAQIELDLAHLLAQFLFLAVHLVQQVQLEHSGILEVLVEVFPRGLHVLGKHHLLRVGVLALLVEIDRVFALLALELQFEEFLGPLRFQIWVGEDGLLNSKG